MDKDIRELSGILDSLGVAKSAELVAGLNIVNYLGHAEGLQLLAAGERQPLGELLLATKRLSRAQLEDALAEQRRSGEMLGAILVRRAMLDAAECRVVLAFQKRQSGRVRNATKLCLGNVLVASRAITRDQLAETLQVQSERGGRLGEALVAAGHLSESQVAKGLQLQRALVAAVMLAALALGSGFPAGEAQASNQMASMQVSAVVRASAQLQTEYQASHLSVSAEDVARGYVDIAAASRFAVAATKGAAYFIDFHPRSELFQSVTIDGLGGRVELGTEGGTVSQPGAGIRGAPSTLNYRFRLRAGLQPGVYDWPLLLAVRAR